MTSAEPQRTLFPSTEPFAVGRLGVGDGHELYYEEFGRRDGKPAVFLHGGPGGGCNRTQSRFWDPQRYRVVLFDQRGCGKSTPHASLEHNTTWHLVEDIEALRKHLGIPRWQVFGGSWGSTLALAYAQRYPEAVTEMVLRGVFLLRKREIDWFYQEGASRIFPEAWQRYLEPIDAHERDDLISAYYARLTGDDRELQLKAARAWSVWEGSTSTLQPNPVMQTAMARESFALAFARIECHYFKHRGFFERDGQLLEGVERLRDIPAVIVQGRYDIVCPAESAYALHQAWPGSELFIAPCAGHSAFESEILHHLIGATERFASGPANT
ncbi:MAG: prolyl aminopeptidase [Myxococcales bacterium]|nr:prolyl aminopeptidase [Myxococcales bacterium]